jgi:hypothetical protein
MHEATRAAVGPLADAAGAVAAFVRGRIGPSGGLRGRGDQEDLYYTAFGAMSLAALGAELPPRLEEYLRAFGDGDGLDLVHVAALGRCWAALPDRLDASTRRGLLRRLAGFRTPDGGFHISAGASHGTGAAAFFAAAAHQDLHADIPARDQLLEALEHLRTADGAYADEPGQPHGITPVVGGVVVVRRHLGRPAEPDVTEWLMARLHARGGFAATPQVPLPDLVSTATALYALWHDSERLAQVRRPCLRFLEALWDEQAGGFRGHALDDAVDCEYTWYGLLALGLLNG